MLRLRTSRAALITLAATLALVAAACSDDDEGGETTGTTGAATGTTAATGATGGTTVAVTLQEFAVTPDTASAPAGSVTFEATNNGPDDTHEFVVFQTDLAPDALPTLPDGSVDETGEGVTLIDEIEDLAVGDSQSLTVDLEAGSYVLICNIYDADEDEAHYQEGMRTGFTVS